ncbi:MAG: hypothetical protein KC468_38185 [Myxococcales bacterium]|nr:hypothetical protein [Myxococcales bacterium]
MDRRPRWRVAFARRRGWAPCPVASAARTGERGVTVSWRAFVDARARGPYNLLE